MPLGPLLADKVRCPGRVGGWVVDELLNLDPDGAGVALEGLAVVVGAVGEVAAWRWYGGLDWGWRRYEWERGDKRHDGAAVRATPLIPVERALKATALATADID